MELETSRTYNWYRVEMINGDETYCYFGSSPLNESEFIKRLQGTDYIELGSLVFFDEEAEAKSWSEWDPNYLPRVYLNPKYVISVIPLMDDPRKALDEESKILNLPGHRSDPS